MRTAALELREYEGAARLARSRAHFCFSTASFEEEKRKEEEGEEATVSRNVSEGTSFFFFALSLSACLSPLFSLKFEALFSSLLPAPTPPLRSDAVLPRPVHARGRPHGTQGRRCCPRRRQARTVSEREECSRLSPEAGAECSPEPCKRTKGRTPPSPAAPQPRLWGGICSNSLRHINRADLKRRLGSSEA